MLIAALGIFFWSFATFEDNSCLSGAYAVTESGEICRLSALEAYCPDPSGPCMAREAKWEAFQNVPACGMVSAERGIQHREIVPHRP